MSSYIKRTVLILLTFIYVLFTVTTPTFAETLEHAGENESVDLSEDAPIQEEQPVDEESSEQPLGEESPEQSVQDANEDIVSGNEAAELQTGVITVQILSSQMQPCNGLVFGIYSDEACTQEEERLLFDETDTCTGQIEYIFNRTLYVKQICTNEYYQQKESVVSVTVTDKMTVAEVELSPVGPVTLPDNESADTVAYDEELTVSTKTNVVETPALIKISNARSGITLSWNEVPGADRYRVFRKSADGTKWKKLADVQTATSYTDRSDLVEGKKYRYTVRCIGQDGSFSSGYDSEGLSMVWLPYVKLKLKKESTDIKISWNAYANVDGYKLYRKEEGTDSWVRIKTIKNRKTTKYTDASTKAGTTYAYRIRAYKSVDGEQYLGYGDKGESIRRWLSAPTLISAKNSETGITVKWKAVSGSKQYKIFRRSGKNSKWKNIGITEKTSYKDKDPIRAGIEYYYTVRCLNEDGKYASSYNPKGKSAKRMLAAPSLKSAKNNGTGGITIRWEAVTGAEKYRVYRRSSAKASWKKIGNTKNDSFTDNSSLTPGKKYYYTVRCISSDGKVKQSSYNSTGVAVKKLLMKPQMVSATQNGGTVTVRWNGVSGAHKYRLLRKENNGSWKAIGETTKTVYKDTKNLKKNGTYFYTVQCISADGKTKESAYEKPGIGLIYNSENRPALPIDFAWDGNAVFIGDSWTYGCGADTRVSRFSTRLSNMMGLNEINFGVKGAGFIIQHKPFSFQLDKAIETMTDAEKEWTRFVFIVGGVNDFRHYGTEANFESYRNAVYDACAIALDNFPNATVVLAQGTIIESGGLQSYHDMIDDCNAFLDENLNNDRVIQIPDIGVLLAKANAVYWAKDALHPSSAGHSLLASYLYAYSCDGSMGVSQYCGSMTPETSVTEKTVCKIWKSNETVYITKGKYVITKKIPCGSSVKIGSISPYFTPNETMEADVNSGTEIVGTIRIDPDGSITFTATKDFKGEISIPKISWPCLGEDNTK